MNVTDDRRTMTYSEHELEFAFAKKDFIYLLTCQR